MKIIFKYLFLFVLPILLSCSQKKTQFVLSETFNKDDKSPFGSYVAYHQFKQIFDNRFIETIEKPFDRSWKDMKEYSVNTKYSLYVLISKNLVLSYGEADAMIDFVKEGNDMLISADYIDNELLSKINCKADRYDEIVSEAKGLMEETSVKINHPDIYNATSYKYYYYPFLNSLYGYDSASTRVLALNDNSFPNYVVMFIGKGRLYLHAAPRAFSNYFLLTENNFQYIENILSYVRPEPKNIFWDEFYKNKSISWRKNNLNNPDKNEFSSFNVINKNPPLLWAFWLSVGAICLYVLFNIKRKQRVIREIKPNINNTVVFAETVGRLYLQKKNNKNIAEKMITYFYEYIRNKYFLDTNKLNGDFINTLSRKSGVEKDITTKIFTAINIFQAKEELSDVELLSLNAQIQNFYKSKTDGRKFI